MKRLMLCALFALMLMLFQSVGYAKASTVITDREGLEAIAADPNADYELGADIDLGEEQWTPVYLNGSLDGKGHVISGLTLSGDYNGENAVFIGGNCHISNLTLSGIDIEVSNADSVTLFGYISIMAGGVSTDDMSVTNCTVTGSIKAQRCRIIYLLQNAYKSTANVSVSLQTTSFSGLNLLENCVKSSYEGNVSCSDGATSGFVRLMNRCHDSMATATVTVEDESSVNLIGMSDCVKCEQYGSMSNSGPTTVACGSGACKAEVAVSSDDLCGLENCRDCSLTATFSNVGLNERLNFTPIDGATDSVVSGKYTYTRGGVEPTFVSCEELMGPGSADYVEIEMKGLSQASAHLLFNRVNDSYEVYRHGDITLSMGGGITVPIWINNTGNITCTSDTGTILIIGGSNNSGDIHAETAGNLNIQGATGYNSGSITAFSSGKTSQGSVYGSKNGVNEGDITITSAYVVAQGGYTYNSGNVSATCADGSQYPYGGKAFAYGVQYGVNTGEITATATNGDATAYVSRQSSAYIGGVARATANGSGHNYTADACSGSGQAFATGETATARGAQPYAQSTYIGQSVSNNQRAWKLTGCTDCETLGGSVDVCPHHQHIVITNGDETPPTDYGSCSYTCYASARPLNTNGDTPPTEPEDPGMPQASEPEGDANLGFDLKLYSGATETLVQRFMRSYGSFSWADGDNDDYTSLYMDIVISNTGTVDESRRVMMYLPSGFSYRTDRVVDYKPFELTVRAGETKAYRTKIYPLFNQVVNAATFVMTGESLRQFSFEIQNNPNEGIVKMRATAGVNAHSEIPLQEEVPLYPVEDFIGTKTTMYSDRLALLGCAISQSVYNKIGAENSDTSLTYESLQNLGFSRIKWYGSVSAHDVAVCFAMKTVVSGGEIRDVMMVAVRGTVAEEWIGNFNVIGFDNTVHADFQLCADSVLNRMAQYMNEYGIERGKVRAFLCGHSRAGAVVDLAAHALNGYPYNNLVRDVTAYTFAAPNCTTNPSADANIFNYIYKYDIVPFVPHGNFKKHGVNYVVGGENGNDAPEDVAVAFMGYTGKPYENVGSKAAIQVILASDEFKSLYVISTDYEDWLGSMIANSEISDMFISRAHGAENYLSWIKKNGRNGSTTIEGFEGVEKSRLLTQAIMENIRYIKASFGTMAPIASVLMDSFWRILPVTCPNGAAIVAVGCPVDVHLLDEAGNVRAAIAGHEVQSFSDGVIAAADGEHSYIMIPTVMPYTLVIDGTGDGDMEINYLYMNADQDVMDMKTLVSPVAMGSQYVICGVAQAGQDPVLGGIPIDESHFPDEAFRRYISEKWDRNQSGYLDDDEIRAADTFLLSIYDPWIEEGFVMAEEANYIRNNWQNSIASLKGIQYFKHLKWLFAFDMSGMSGELDLSENTMLENVSVWNDGLTKLVLGTNPNLAEIHCENNSLGVLDVSGCPALKQLFCTSDALTSLDISKSLSLTHLYCSGNQIKSLEIGGCPLLEIVTCSGNQITALDLRGASGLCQLDVSGNPLHALDVSGCPNLVSCVDEAYYGEDGSYAWYQRDLEDGTGCYRLAFNKGMFLYTDIATGEMIVLPLALIEIGEEAFAGISASIVYVQQDCAAIGSRAFANCPNLRAIYVPEDTQIAEDAFEDSNAVIVYRVRSNG